MKKTRRPVTKSVIVACKECGSTDLESDQRIFGGFMCVMRESYGVSSRQMAKGMGISHQLLLSLEAGWKTWGWDGLMKFVKVCKKFESPFEVIQKENKRLKKALKQAKGTK